ncbi:hypothetical protein L596_009656 [Steinernema carpocapsae]|uniref:Uncharacterized protein n=1 Tax=Steinernema carpocapsae TaxID=34508 RepID=A0A4U5PGS2_STECR|nr:hypothetical protein L596_009656 [Steinernema carpocapsae]
MQTRRRTRARGRLQKATLQWICLSRRLVLRRLLILATFEYVALESPCQDRCASVAIFRLLGHRWLSNTSAAEAVYIDRRVTSETFHVV